MYAPNIAIIYLVDSYPGIAGQGLIAVSSFKNLVAFLFLFTVVGWTSSQGWIQVYMILFMLLTLSMLLAVPMYFYGVQWGKRGRLNKGRSISIDSEDFQAVGSLA